MAPSSQCRLPNKLKTCVLAYALIPGGWVRAFIAHYRPLVDGLIYILCPEELANHPDFQDDKVRVMPLPPHDYQDRLIAEMYEKFAAILLYYYTSVLIPDIDEFFVPAIYDHNGYLIETDFPTIVSRASGRASAIRALGIHVVQLPHESDYDISKDVPSQRSLGHLVSPMNKIAMLLEPCRLTNGKHFTTHPCRLLSILQPIDSGSHHYVLLNYHMHHACQSLARTANQAFSDRAVSPDRISYYHHDRPVTYPFLMNRMKEGKVRCPIHSLFSLEVDTWINEWNQLLIQAETEAKNNFIIIEQSRATFLVELPKLSSSCESI
jgi:hypothetical protein